ncbi:MAG: hydrogenase [Candidatus Fraserbacteria bacterium RBG_16_55_9]|uniref:Hydrogenase n=1 Tax=Fraserbacteria sp. (strain RBG_16_55_9) TaxID=1817864 RepID=A0A1F5UXA1_FRAXR|nr:MAG: hydrogenase [Candidatus Fraserbacteria bacterium RBG_16_55_9]
MILLVPLLTAALCGLVGTKRFMEVTSILGTILTASFSVLLINKVLLHQSLLRLGGLLYADALSAYLVLIVSLIGVLATLYSIGYIGHEYSSGLFSAGKLREYYFLLNLFLFTVLLAAVANNLGVLWVAIEGTTLASAFLVGFYNQEESIEAAWKYLILGSVGITFALFGTVLVYFSALAAFQASGGSGTLNWTELVNPSVASQLDPRILKLAFLFILVGYGTKAGLVPMHTWLPDAHSQAPTPISALLSGVLINAAMYGILRFHHLLGVSSVGSGFSSNLLLIFGLLSIGIATPFILMQKDYKRLLAYSSIEHMGLIATGMGLGTPVAIYGALLHTLNHAIAKAMIFMNVGNLVLKFQTKEISYVKGIVKIMPTTGVLLLLSTLAITGVPPFNMFISEFLILSASVASQSYLAGSLILLFLVAAFAGFLYHISQMAFGSPKEGLRSGEENSPSFLPIGILLALVLMLGLYIPQPLHELLQQAVTVVKP